jgi:hypothetical protein
VAAVVVGDVVAGAVVDGGEVDGGALDGGDVAKETDLEPGVDFDPPWAITAMRRTTITPPAIRNPFRK